MKVPHKRANGSSNTLVVILGRPDSLTIVGSDMVHQTDFEQIVVSWTISGDLKDAIERHTLAVMRGAPALNTSRIVSTAP